MKELVLVLESRYADTLGAVRGIPGLKAATDEGNIWLRGITPAAKPDTLLASLPVVQSYVLDAEDRLFPAGSLTPTGKLKPLHWQPIKAFIPVKMPVSAMPGTAPAKIQLQLSRSGQVQEPFALLVSLDDWKAYAETAPLTRLGRLQFAVSPSGNTLITGSPLPLLKGKGHWQNGQMLLPLGFDFDPPAIASLIADALGADNNHYILFDSDGGYEYIPIADFVQVTRSAVRLTRIA
ncbi:hypothetical protein ACFFGT_06650 [Mucilaginibacter angelicae]|uniref:MoxR-vWA-beta-propeller ternary system domain-containing protein n=1 Tax=Mucilaginibacter angelicae TaxID=869718 RepID=A0ABV6L2A9_9SPHI